MLGGRDPPASKKDALTACIYRMRIVDLPKELFKKELPKAHAAQGTAKDHTVKAVQSAPPEAEADDALFLQAMQGMVKTPRVKKSAAHHGAFPLHTDQSFKKIPQAEARTASAVSAEISSQPTSPQKPSPLVKDTIDSADNDFALAMRTVKALKGKGRDIIPPVEAVDAAAAQGKALQDLLDGEIVFDVQVSGENIQGHVVGLDEKSFLALASGVHSPEARLDLHGMNAQQAFQALVPFFRTAWHKGLRTVIIVTGRGMNSPTGIGILRHKVYTWLTQEPFMRVVMAFCTARPCDGGAGSMYVLLRKYRKKHRVYWERCPSDADLFS